MAVVDLEYNWMVFNSLAVRMDLQTSNLNAQGKNGSIMRKWEDFVE